MKFFYFPFTHVPVQDRVLMGGILKQVFYLSSDPEQTWSAGTWGEKTGGRQVGKRVAAESTESFCKPDLVLVPFPRDMRDKVVGLLADHRQWAAHSGAGPGQLKSLLRKTPYFTSDTQVSAIRSQIQKKVSPEPSREDPEQALVKALAFLCLARENDEQKAAIDDALSNINEKKHRLFATLIGEESTTINPDNDENVSFIPTGTGDDPGALMTPLRIRSWFKVFSRLAGTGNAPMGGSDEPVMLITTSPAVVDFFEQISQDGQLLLDKEINYVHKETCATDSCLQDQLLDDIRDAVSGQGAFSPMKEKKILPDGPRLKLHLFKGDEIRRFFHWDHQNTAYLLPDAWIEGKLFICLIDPVK